MIDLVDSFGNVDCAKYNRDERHQLGTKVNALRCPQNLGCKNNHCNIHEHKRLIARCLWLTEEDVDAVGSRDIPDRIVGVTLFDGSLDFSNNDAWSFYAPSSESPVQQNRADLVFCKIPRDI